MPKFVFLWTDFVLWLVVLGVAVYAWKVRANRHALATWRQVARDAPAMSAAVVLGLFIAIALLDSVHFRPRLPAAPGAAPDAPAAYATRTVSVLDVLLAHATESREKTYSLPLAYWSFQKETQVVNGREVRDHPRLAFGGVHLKDPEREWVPDVLARSAAGTARGWA